MHSRPQGQAPALAVQYVLHIVTAPHLRGMTKSPWVGVLMGALWGPRLGAAPNGATAALPVYNDADRPQWVGYQWIGSGSGRAISPTIH